MYQISGHIDQQRPQNMQYLHLRYLQYHVFSAFKYSTVVFLMLL
jgi:hypothetical protein